MDHAAQHCLPAPSLVFSEVSHLQGHLHPVQMQVHLLVFTHQFYPHNCEIDTAVQVGAAVIVENREFMRGKLTVANLCE